MRPEGQPPPDRIIRVFLTWHCRRGGGDMNATASIFPRRALHVLKPVDDSRSCDRKYSTAAVRTALPCLKSKTGEEAATPGQPVALSRVSGSFPSAIRSRESPLLLARRNHRSSQERSRFAGTQFLLLCCVSQHKKESALCRNCGG